MDRQMGAWLGGVLVRDTIALMKHREQKLLGEERAYLASISRVTAH